MYKVNIKIYGANLSIFQEKSSATRYLILSCSLFGLP
ncbi:MAG: hypothetical protein ACI9KF_001244, partial [Arenicella sp.]